MASVKIDKYLRLGIGILAVVLVYVLYAGIHQHVVVAGDTAPEFSITADNGQTVSLPNFGGKLLILNFWASWCGPCIEETPSLSEFAKEYADKGVVVLAVSVDKNPQAYQKFLQKFQPGFLYARDMTVHEEYGTFMYPETYFINSKGKVVWKIPETPDPESPATLDWTDAKVKKYIESLMNL
jgi:cytochrome c biogenesis protein CcmG, thiol:disulfide interchange protein DsbE